MSEMQKRYEQAYNAGFVGASRIHGKEIEQLRSDLATLRAQNYETQSLLKGAEAECDALREALARVCNHGERTSRQITADWDAARAAITKAGGNDE